MKQAILKLVKCLMVPAGALCSLAAPASIRILMYHRVNDGIRKELSVTVSDFIWQMKYLKRKGYEVVPLDEALRLRPLADAKKSRLAVLTFDDGYEDFLINAFPVLRDFGYPALVYLVPGYIGTGGVFWWDADLGESALMSWNQIDGLKDGTGIQFGSHTLSHADLDGLDAESLRREILESRAVLQGRLSREIRHFAYPRGILPKGAPDELRACYQTAVSIFDGDALVCGGYAPDPMKLRRTPVQRSDGRLLFGARLKGWLEPERWVRKAMGRPRGRPGPHGADAPPPFH